MANAQNTFGTETLMMCRVPSSIKRTSAALKGIGEIEAALSLTQTLDEGMLSLPRSRTI